MVFAMTELQQTENRWTKPAHYAPQTHSHRLELWKLGYRALFAEIGNKPLVIAFSMGLRSIVEQSKWVQDNLGYKIVWVSREVKGMRYEREHDVLAGDLKTILKLARLRKQNTNTVALLVHMAAPHGSAWRIKDMIPGCKACCYLYDAINLWVPRDKLHLWDQYQNSKGSNAGEYEAAEDVMRGDYIEGLVYKDYGPNWPVLDNCKAITAWAPSVHEKNLFTDPPPQNVPERFCFIGTIMPKTTHERPAGLFSDIMMEDIFASVAAQGYNIHAYVLNLSEEVRKEYRARFTNGRVQLFQGALLTYLLPRLAGRYKWGWMLYNFPQQIIMPLIHNTLPTKLFTYMTLCIPIVVSEEFKAVARFVTEHNIGVVVKRNEHNNIPAVLARYNHTELVSNILKVRDQYCIDRYLACMGDVIKQVMEGPTKPIPKKPKFLELEADHYAKTQQKAPQTFYESKRSWCYEEGKNTVERE